MEKEKNLLTHLFSKWWSLGGPVESGKGIVRGFRVGGNLYGPEMVASMQLDVQTHEPIMHQAV